MTLDHVTRSRDEIDEVERAEEDDENEEEHVVKTVSSNDLTTHIVTHLAARCITTIYAS